jgi:hypothetical protein
MYKTAGSIFLIIILIYSGCNTRTDASKFNGLWKLYKYESMENGSWQTDSTRIGHNGFILYDGLGHMSVQILPGNFNTYTTHK